MAARAAPPPRGSSCFTALGDRTRAFPSPHILGSCGPPGFQLALLLAFIRKRKSQNSLGAWVPSMVGKLRPPQAEHCGPPKIFFLIKEKKREVSRMNCFHGCRHAILPLLHSRCPLPLVTASGGLAGDKIQAVISQAHALVRLGLLHPFVCGLNCAKDSQEALSINRSPAFYGAAADLPPLGIGVKFPVKVGTLLAGWSTHTRSPKCPGSTCGSPSHWTLSCPLVDVSPLWGSGP